MKNKKSLLSVSGHIFDVTGSVQLVSASIAGELKYRGCGIIIHRGNHINGNAIIFLKYTGQQLIFGEWVDTYSSNDGWKSWDYEKFEMATIEHAIPLISSADGLLRRSHIIQ